MNGNSILLDTNTVLYFLSGDETISDFIKQKKIFISIITEMELLSYSKITSKELKIISGFISEITVININNDIKETAIKIRRSSKLKLPDSIIAASSIFLQIPLITADKEIKNVEGLNIIYYEK
jgi:predicted nucleic acid-binding protein